MIESLTIEHKKTGRAAIFFFIIFVGFSLRLSGSDWGFPYLLHPDEPSVVNRAVELAQKQTREPTYYTHPNHVTMQINAGIQMLVSRFYYEHSPQWTFDHHRTLFYQIARIIVALFGTLSIIVAYLIGRTIHVRVALHSALLFSFFPLFIRHAHFATPDVPLVFFVMLCLLFCIHYLKKPTINILAFACMAAALATVEKYPGALCTLMIGTMIFIKNYKDIRSFLSQSFLAATFFFTFLILISPYLFIHYSKVFSKIHHEMRPTHLGADDLDWGGNMRFYFENFLEHGGIILILFAFFGLWRILASRNKTYIPLFIGVIFWLFLSKLSLHWERWGLPMYITPLFFAAVGIHEIYGSLKKMHKWRKCAFITVTAFYGLIITNLLLGSLLISGSFFITDSRIASMEYIQNIGMDKENSMFEGYTPFHPGTYRDLDWKPSDSQKEFIMLSSIMYQRYLNEPQRYSGKVSMYQHIFRKPLLKEFRQCFEHYDFESRRPDIFEFFNIKNNVAQLKLMAKKECFGGPEIKIYKNEFVDS